MAKKADEDQTAQLKVRLPESLRKKIELAAKKRFDGKGQSLNAEMLDRLERSFGRGLLDEILTLAYGPTSAVMLMEAHRNGMLRITDESKEQMVESVRKFLAEVQKGTLL